MSLDAKQNLCLAKLGGKVLVGHVESSSSGGDEHLPCLDWEGYVVDVWMEPAVGLAIHCLWSQCSCH